MIPCGALYSFLGGYRHKGGKYEDAQEMLAHLGWHYNISLDAWVPPPKPLPAPAR